MFLASLPIFQLHFSPTFFLGSASTPSSIWFGNCSIDVPYISNSVSLVLRPSSVRHSIGFLCSVGLSLCSYFHRFGTLRRPPVSWTTAVGSYLGVFIAPSASQVVASSPELSDSSALSLVCDRGFISAFKLVNLRLDGAMPFETVVVVFT